MDRKTGARGGVTATATVLLMRPCQRETALIFTGAATAFVR